MIIETGCFKGSKMYPQEGYCFFDEGFSMVGTFLDTRIKTTETDIFYFLNILILLGYVKKAEMFNNIGALKFD